MGKQNFSLYDLFADNPNEKAAPEGPLKGI